MAELTAMTVYGAEYCEERNTGRVGERGRRAIFTVFPSKSPSANHNVYVG